MALSSSLLETNIGISLNNTYARIVSMRCERDEIMLMVSHYASAEASNIGSMSVFDRTMFAPMSEIQPADTPLAMGYAWLKTQPEYASAEDC